MKYRLFVCLILVLSLCSVLTAYAQDASATPKPGTRADNECYTGGTMAGRCDNGFHADGSTTPDEVAWAWRCGWYMARFNDGTIARGDVPSDCASLLPGIPPPEAPECFVVQDTPTIHTQICVTGSQAYQVADVLVGTGWIHLEHIALWVMPDTSIGDGGKCATFISDLNKLNGIPVFNWLQGIWTRKGFKPIDDVCSF